MKHIPLFFLSILFFACESPIKEDHQRFTEEDFTVIDTDPGLEQDSIRLSSTLEMLLVDSILITSNMEDSLVVSAYNLNTKEKINSFIERGGDKNQLLSLTSLSILDRNRLVGFDATLQKTVSFNLDTAIFKGKYEPDEEKLLNASVKGTRDLQVYDDSLFIGTSYFFDDSRVFIMDHTSKIRSKSGYLPFNLSKNNGKGKLSLKAMYNAVGLEYNRNSKTAFLPYKNSERIDIYRDTALYKILIGQNYDVPNMEIDKVNGKYLIKPNKKTKHYFVNSYSTDNYIYCIRSGDNQPVGKELYIFDWEGKPKWKLLLNKEYASVVAKERENYIEIYFLDNQNLLYKFILNT